MKKQHGLSLVELMIAMVIGLAMLTAVISIFLQTKESFNQNDKLVRMQDDARFALEELSRDISMAGFWAEMTDVNNIVGDTNLALATDCGPAGTPWAYDLSEEITSLDNATGAEARLAHSCISESAFQTNTDVIAIKRVTGSTTTVLQENSVYLKSNATVGLLLNHPEDTTPALVVPPPVKHMKYSPAIYYIRNHGANGNAGDGIPSLCKKFLDTSGAAPTIGEECIAQGIEDLQLEYGIDTDGDNVIDQYKSNPTMAELQGLVSVRIFLLVRSIQPQVGYINEKSYQLSNKPAVVMNDAFYRRVYSTTVVVRNSRNQLNFGI